MRLTLDEFLAPDSPQRQPVLLPGHTTPVIPTQTFVLHSVLVHAGDVGGGHYYAYIRPSVDGNYSDCLATSSTAAAGTTSITGAAAVNVTVTQVMQSWYKFNDEQVLKVLPREAVLECFGQRPSPFLDDHHQQGYGTTMSSAYMLVYILESRAKDEIMKEVDSADIPTDLVDRLNMEEYRKRVLELYNRCVKHTLKIYYMTEWDVMSFTNYTKDEDFCVDLSTINNGSSGSESGSGSGISGGGAVSIHTTHRSVTVSFGHSTLGLVFAISKDLKVPAHRLRLWLMSKRNNGVYRVGNQMVINASSFLKRNEIFFVEILPSPSSLLLSPEQQQQQLLLQKDNNKSISNPPPIESVLTPGELLEQQHWSDWCQQLDTVNRVLQKLYHRYICVMLYKKVLLQQDIAYNQSIAELIAVHDGDDDVNKKKATTDSTEGSRENEAFVAKACRAFEQVLLQTHGAKSSSYSSSSSDAAGKNSSTSDTTATTVAEAVNGAVDNNTINELLAPILQTCHFGSNFHRFVEMYLKDVENSCIEMILKSVDQNEREILTALKKFVVLLPPPSTTTAAAAITAVGGAAGMVVDPYLFSPPFSPTSAMKVTTGSSSDLQATLPADQREYLVFGRLFEREPLQQQQQTSSLSSSSLKLPFDYQRLVLEKNYTYRLLKLNAQQERNENLLLLSSTPTAAATATRHVHAQRLFMYEKYLQTTIKRLMKCPVKYIGYFRFKPNRTYTQMLRHFFHVLHSSLVAPITAATVAIPWGDLTDQISEKEVSGLRVWRQHCINEIKDMSVFEASNQPNVPLTQLGAMGDVFLVDPVYDGESKSIVNAFTYFQNIVFKMSLPFRPYTDVDKTMLIDHKTTIDALFGNASSDSGGGGVVGKSGVAVSPNRSQNKEPSISGASNNSATATGNASKQSPYKKKLKSKGSTNTNDESGGNDSNTEMDLQLPVGSTAARHATATTTNATATHNVRVRTPTGAKRWR